MAKPNNILNCETCGEPAQRLAQSYSTGDWECPPCAIEDPSPFMTPEVRKALERRAREHKTWRVRAAGALRNFHGQQETAQEVPACRRLKLRPQNRLPSPSTSR